MVSSNRALASLHPIQIVHFNDVYNIDESASAPIGGAARFVTAIQQSVANHSGPSLVLFSGDAFSPAPLTHFTNGAEIPPILNATNIDVACIGNHEMDCGVEVMKQRISETTFPWLISNIWESPLPDSNSKGMHSSTKRVPFAGLKSMHTISRGGVKFGFMGLASWEWVSNIGERVLPLIEYIDYVQACNQFANENLAKQALDIDIILGGHDHILWKEFINGRWIVKSGTDFRNFSTINLHIRGEGKLYVDEPIHHDVSSAILEHPEFALFISEQNKILGPRWLEVITKSHIALDGRFTSIRTKETALGNIFCDIMTLATNADVGMINSGSFRSDTLHPAGNVTYGMIKMILPYMDEVVVAAYSGAELIERLESSVSRYPELAGGFCQVSGISFSFDPRATPGKRICSDSVKCRSAGKMRPIEPSRMYKCALKNWIFGGNDGFPLSDASKLVGRSEECLSIMILNHFSQNASEVPNAEAGYLSLSTETSGERIECLFPDEKFLKSYE